MYSSNRFATDDNYMNAQPNMNLQQRSGPMRVWLNSHLHDPYPSSQEKQKLADECNKTYIQVCTWFANARRSLRRQGIIGPRLRRTKTTSSMSSFLESQEFSDDNSDNEHSGRKIETNNPININNYQLPNEGQMPMQNMMGQTSLPSQMPMDPRSHEL